MAIPFNPYVAGNPVGDSPAFIGRADVLREVLRVLRRPQDNAIVLYGQRRIGKTSILQHLAARFPKAKAIASEEYPKVSAAPMAKGPPTGLPKQSR